MPMQSYQFDLPKIIEYLRGVVRQANKQDLVNITGIPYTRLIYFARSAQSTPNPADLTALVKHYMPDTTFVVPVKVPPAPPAVTYIPSAPVAVAHQTA